MAQSRYKIRFYHVDGPQKSNLRKEEYYDTLGEAVSRFRETFRPGLLALNPTVWVCISVNADLWKRLTNAEIAEGFGVH